MTYRSLAHVCQFSKLIWLGQQNCVRSRAVVTTSHRHNSYSQCTTDQYFNDNNHLCCFSFNKLKKYHPVNHSKAYSICDNVSNWRYLHTYLNYGSGGSMNVVCPVVNRINRRLLNNIQDSSQPLAMYRAIHTDSSKNKEESKIEQTVEMLKDESKETEAGPVTDLDPKSKSGDATGPSPRLHSQPMPTILSPNTSTVDKPKSLTQRFIDEVKHYYHGFRLLAVDVKICVKLLWSVLHGKTLTRRERNLLVRTTADLFRLLPFSVFIIVPFMEFLLPVAVKLFPGMLPSTFKTQNKEQEKLKKRLKVKLDMAKFLQDTIEESAVQNKDKSAKKMGHGFAQFLEKVRVSGQPATNEEIMKFSKLFEDEMTLDNLSTAQLKALCRVLEIHPIGTNNFLRFQLRFKLRQLKADDKMIHKEGIESLAVWELQAACRTRGMRSLGVPEANLRENLQQWIDLHLNEHIPPSLLLMSRALYLPEQLSTEEQLKATISQLPQTAGESAKMKAAELAGEKVDNKAKLDLLRKEAEAIELEKAEQEAEEKKVADAVAAVLEKEAVAEAARARAPIDQVDAGPTIVGTKPDPSLLPDQAPVVQLKVEEELADIEKEHQISREDLEDIELAVESIDEEKSIELELKELKEDVSEYQEEVQELKDVIVRSGGDFEDLTESKAASRLSKKVNQMIEQMHDVIVDLQKQKAELMENIEVKEVKMKHNLELKKDNDRKEEILQQISQDKGDVIGINEMVLALRRIQKVPDDTKIQRILEVLDDNSDGQIDIQTVMKVIEVLGRENVKLEASQISKVIELMKQEDIIEDIEKHHKATGHVTQSHRSCDSDCQSDSDRDLSQDQKIADKQ